MKKTGTKTKWGILLFTVVASGFIAACALCIGALSVPVFAMPASLCVVLDAGHGGVDGGVTGRDTGVKESEINLAVTMEIKSAFERAGFEVVLTRKTSAGLYGAATKGYKKRDMLRRKEIIEEAKPAAVISVHQNFYPTRVTRGGQVFYRKESETGQKLAESMQERLNALYRGEGAAPRKAASGNYYMLTCTDYPSVIVECGFLSNGADEALLVTEAFHKSLAQAVLEGFAGYLSAVSGA